MPAKSALPQTVDAILDYIKENPTLPWPIMSHLITCLEKKGYLPDDQSKKTWMETVFQVQGLKRTAAWRYRALGRDYPWLKTQLKHHGIPIPELVKLDPKVNPEQLEILIRMIKTVDPSVWKPIADGVLKQTLSLRDTRRAWSVYRPMLKGRTARQYGSAGFIDIVTVDTKTEAMQREHQISDLRQQLARYFPLLLWSTRLTRHPMRWAFHSLVVPTEIYGTRSRPHQIYLDAVAAVQWSHKNAVELHGFLIEPIAVQRPADFLVLSAADSVDALWQVIPNADAAVGDPVGSIIHADAMLKIHEKPTHKEISNPILLRFLLTKGLQLVTQDDLQKLQAEYQSIPR